MKKAILIISILSVIITVSVILFINHRLYDSSKLNIFEIPGTACSSPVGKWKRYYRYYMIQEVPEAENELKNLIEDYINDNGTITGLLTENTEETVCLYFYKPSLSLPVYFEENKSYWEMDDYIEHYKDEHIATVIYQSMTGETKY